MEKKNLTPTRIKNLCCPENKQQVFLWDKEVQGLAVRATKNAKVFIVQKRLTGGTGSPIRVKIGSTDLTLEDARNKAREIITQLSQGIDPRVEKQHVAQQAELAYQETLRENVTVGIAWQEYILERQAHWSEKYCLDHTRFIQAGGEQRKRSKEKTKSGVIYPLTKFKISEINKTTIKAWLKKEVANRPTQARIGFEMFRTFLNWCEDDLRFSGLAQADSCSTKVKKDYIPAKQSRDDCLQKEMLPSWFAAVSTYRNKIMGAYFQTLLLTGARREELLSLRWDQVDFRWKSIHFTETKGGEDRMIPLTPYIAHLLMPLPRRNKWVFSSARGKEKRITSPFKAFSECNAISNIEGLTLHGLRRSFKTLSEWCELPTGIVDQIQGHKPSSTVEKHYKKRPLDLLRMWHIQFETWILEQASIDLPDQEKVYQPQLKVVGSK